MHRDEFYEGNFKDIYDSEGIDEALDSDEISAEEEGFLQGYEEAANSKKKKKDLEED